jgi:uncharacterized protein (DUF433 family)
MSKEASMKDSSNDYVQQTPGGAWRIHGTRVSLDSLVHAYWEGQSPEAIADDFPTLSLEQIHGATAFYLRHRQEIDQYMASQENRWEEFRRESQAKHGPLVQRIRNSQSTV